MPIVYVYFCVLRWLRLVLTTWFINHAPFITAHIKFQQVIVSLQWLERVKIQPWWVYPGIPMGPIIFYNIAVCNRKHAFTSLCALLYQSRESNIDKYSKACFQVFIIMYSKSRVVMHWKWQTLNQSTVVIIFDLKIEQYLIYKKRSLMCWSEILFQRYLMANLALIFALGAIKDYSYQHWILRT